MVILQIALKKISGATIPLLLRLKKYKEYI